MKTPIRPILCLAAFSGLVSLLSAATVGTDFVYQGNLAEGGQPANGSYDLRVAIYDAAAGGTAVAAPRTNTAVAVSNGLFSTALDFGPVFDGAARWLELGVRTNGGGEFTTLQPRQEIKAAPYSLHALVAGTAVNVTGPVSAGQLAGTISPANIGAGTITGPMLASGALAPPQTIAGTNQAAVANSSYVAASALPTAIMLPVSAGIGDSIQITAAGAGGWSAYQSGGWTARETNRAWNSIASSADGTRLVASVDGGQIYTSTDAGATWTARDASRSWQAVASSADGLKLAALLNGGQVYTSPNGGTNWIARGNSRGWMALASSADGARLVGVVGGGQIYTSTDYGVNWTPRGSSRFWWAVASSADGTNLVAVEFGGQIYTSSDAGTNWIARESNRNWVAVAASSSGANLAAVVQNGQIYTSADYGTNWTSRASSRSWQAVASSADGVKLAALDNGGKIYVSTDAGANWIAQESNRSWWSLASSADGNKLVAVNYGGRIYTSGGIGTLVASGSQGGTATIQYLGNGQWGAVAQNQVAAGAIGSAQLRTGAVAATHIAAGAVGSAQLAANVVQGTNIAGGQVLRSLNGLTDNLQLVGGTNIAVTASAMQLQLNLTGTIGAERLPTNLNAAFLSGLEASHFWINGSTGIANFKGSVGIGTGNPQEKLSVDGTIQSLSGGFRFPDGTVQTTAAVMVHSNQSASGLPAGSTFNITVDGQQVVLARPFEVLWNHSAEPDERNEFDVLIHGNHCASRSLVLRRRQTGDTNWLSMAQRVVEAATASRVSTTMQVTVPGGGRCTWQFTNGLAATYALVLADDGVPFEEIEVYYQASSISRTKTGTFSESVPVVGLNNGLVSGNSALRYRIVLNGTELTNAVVSSDTKIARQVIAVAESTEIYTRFNPGVCSIGAVSVQQNASASSNLPDWFFAGTAPGNAVRQINLVLKNTPTGNLDLIGQRTCLPSKYKLFVASDGLPVEEIELQYAREVN